MGLIARELEGRGIPTVGLTSALSITQAARQPRAALVDYPLGHTAGRAHDMAGQRALLREALAFIAQADGPEAVRDLGCHWADTDAWKDTAMREKVMRDGELVEYDDRLPRYDQPQYQSKADAAEAAAQPECETCVFLTPEEA